MTYTKFYSNLHSFNNLFFSFRFFKDFYRKRGARHYEKSPTPISISKISLKSLWFQRFLRNHEIFHEILENSGILKDFNLQKSLKFLENQRFQRFQWFQRFQRFPKMIHRFHWFLWIQKSCKDSKDFKDFIYFWNHNFIISSIDVVSFKVSQLIQKKDISQNIICSELPRSSAYFWNLSILNLQTQCNSIQKLQIFFSKFLSDHRKNLKQ